jgi:hypothetical protein
MVNYIFTFESEPGSSPTNSHLAVGFPHLLSYHGSSRLILTTHPFGSANCM